MKYQIINKENPFYGHTFSGEIAIISNEKRVWDNDSSGRSYPFSDCSVILSEEQSNQLISLKSYFPYRICFGVILPDGEYQTHANTDKRKMNKFARLGYPVFQVK